jgi:hypothetical protein
MVRPPYTETKNVSRKYFRARLCPMRHIKTRWHDWRKWDPDTDPANCALCDLPMIQWERGQSKRTRKRVAVWDHCHGCGHHRGWLCARCNHAEGFASSRVMPSRYRHLYASPLWVRRLRDYLDNHRCHPNIRPTATLEPQALSVRLIKHRK